jgi:hypothetical protein
MSNLIDSLRRENKFNEKLQYDDGAFYYFFSALTLIIVFPLAISTLRQLFRKKTFNLNKDAPPKLLGQDIGPIIKKEESSSKINRTLVYKVWIVVVV